MAEIGHNNPDTTISYADLRAILDDVDSTGKAVTEANGTHRSNIKTILEDREWNKTAFADIRKIDNMSETKRADYLRTLQPLLQIMLDAKWTGELDDLLSQLDQENEPGEGEEDGGEGDEE